MSDRVSKQEWREREREMGGGSWSRWAGREEAGVTDGERENSELLSCRSR